MIKRIVIALATSVLVASAMEIRPLMVGQSIPDTPLKTAEGKVFDLQAAAQEQPLVVIFYRGGWCPFCNQHLGQLQEAASKLHDLGYRIVAISPDRPEELGKSAEQHQLSYTLLSDSSMAAAKAFGLAFEVDEPMLEKLASYNIDIEAASGEMHHLLPVPAVFIIGTGGLIDFSYANPDYKTRLAPEVLLAAAKAAL
ncbi:MAG: peroxiredoxin-like family protein [Pontiella sp.]